MYLKKTIFLLLVLAFVSCKRQEDYGIKPVIEGKPVAKIKLYNNEDDYRMEKIGLSEFVDSVKFVKLETSPECWIDMITKILFVDDRMIVIDGFGRKIFLFDSSGSFIRTIANRGRGPGEYLNITSCNYDNARQILSVYDGTSMKLLLYNLNGDLIQETPIITSNGAPIRQIINLPNGNYLCYSEMLSEKVGDYSGLWEMGSQGNFIRNLFRYDIEATPVFFSPQYSSLQHLSDGTITIKDIMHHDIYHYNNGSLQRYISYESKYDNQIALTFENREEVRSVVCMTAQEKGDYIISFWAVSPLPFFSLYDKKQNKNRFTDTFDNSNINAVWNPSMKDSNSDSVLVIEISGSTIIRMLNDENTSAHTKKVLNNLVAGMSESDIEAMNPILEILYLKK